MLGNTSRRRVFPQGNKGFKSSAKVLRQLQFSQIFTSVSMTRQKHGEHFFFYFFQRTPQRKKGKRLVYRFDYQNVNKLTAASWRFESVYEEDLDKVSNDQQIYTITIRLFALDFYALRRAPFQSMNGGELYLPSNILHEKGLSFTSC